jgi:hypothetical protein
MGFMRNIELKALGDKTVLVNWDNVASVTEPENYLLGQVGDTGGCLQVNFINKQSVYTKDSLDDIKSKLNDTMIQVYENR